MGKSILIVLAFLALVVASCQKSNNNSNYTCTCSYVLVTGNYSRDTTVATNFAAGTSTNDARNSCTDESNVLQSTGHTAVSCSLSAH